MNVAFVLQIVQRVGEGIHNGELTFSHPRSRTHISAEGYGDKSDSLVSSIDMSNYAGGQLSAQKILKQTGALKAATLYFAS